MPKKCSISTCIDTTSQARGFCAGLLLVDFRQKAHEGTSEMMSSRASKFSSPSTTRTHFSHIAVIESAASSVEPLQSKMTALGRAASRSENLESKLTMLLNHTAFCCSPQSLTLHNPAQKRVEPSWLISIGATSTLRKRRVSNSAEDIWPIQQSVPFALVRFFWP